MDEKQFGITKIIIDNLKNLIYLQKIKVMVYLSTLFYLSI